MRKKSEEVLTTEFCCYGCGNLALFKNNSNKLTCSSSSNSCPANKKKNSEGLKRDYIKGTRVQKEVYKSLPQETKDRMNWNKGNFSADFSYNGKGSHKEVLKKERGSSCEECKLDKWLDKPIPLELDHIDGDNRNNIKQNLRLLCPNCHAFTPTYRGRGKNTGRKDVTDEKLLFALNKNDNIIKKALEEVGMTPKGTNYERCYSLLSNQKLASIC
jgi:hypothetical protein